MVEAIRPSHRDAEPGLRERQIIRVPGAPQQDQLRGERAYSWQRLEQSQRLRIRQRPAGVRVERVTPAWPGLRPDGYASFLERQQVAFDGAGRDFEPFGQLRSAPPFRAASAGYERVMLRARIDHWMANCDVIAG